MAHESNIKVTLLNDEPWPDGGLETLGHCPLCGDRKRTTLYERLRDIVFNVAPGTWALHRCNGCQCLYIDPRPTFDSIGLAYRSYYTHEGTQRLENDDLTALQRVSRTLANGYRNGRYGTHERPAHWFGSVLGYLLPAFRRRAAPSIRCLSPQDRGARVLDVGCGGGNFLYWAKAMGCDVFACDPDPIAAKRVQHLGISVRQGGIETYLDKRGCFDLVTMGHVVEHLHNPGEAMTISRQLLRSGGRIWLETPNCRSRGFEVYGQYWRGLEVPRHLVLFDQDSLAALAARAGFEDIQVLAGLSGTILPQSARLAKNHDFVVRMPRASASLPNCETIQLIAIAP